MTKNAATAENSTDQLPEDAASDAPAAGAGRILWNEENMQQAYANVATVMATQEEMSMIFGTQRGLRPGPNGMVVDIQNRMIVSPHLAKRLNALLTNAIEQYEKQFGKLPG
ncbi:MAG: DUF3467 domain-containing protein [Pseudomonadota bacterium]